MTNEIRVEYVPLSTILRWDRNPKDHDLPSIKGSIGRFGFTTPVLVDERTGKLAAGHGRIDSLVELKTEGKEAPLRILVDPQSGDWLIPVLRGVSFNSDSELEAYLVADNRLTIAGGWNTDNLSGILGDLLSQGEDALVGVGYSPTEVQDLLQGIGKPPSLDELEQEFGKPEDGAFDPIIRIKVSPELYQEFQNLMDGTPGDDDEEKLSNILSAVDRSALGWLSQNEPETVGIDEDVELGDE